MVRPKQTNVPYVLMTAARNEEAYIEATILSVVHQTLVPLKWVIVSDGSEDGTDEIVRRYAGHFPFIELVRMADRHSRNFASKVFALNAAVACLGREEYSFIGNLDADISFEPTYLSSLLGKFEQDQRLGLAGGFIYEKDRGAFKSRPTNSPTSVAGAVQMFRRECYESIGGLTPLSFGGEDWYAEISARMKGWRVLAFPDLAVYHHRPTGTAENRLRHWYRQGQMDHSVGCHPLFEVVKMGHRLRAKPYVLGAVARLCGFTLAHVRAEARAVPPEAVRFLQDEQRERLRPFRRRLAE